MTARTALAALGLAALAACQTTPAPVGPPDSLEDLTSNRAALTAFLAGTTVRTFDPTQGVQVEYLAPSGTTALWYPGQADPVTGDWKVQDRVLGPALCFRYDRANAARLPGTRPDVWNCAPAASYLASMQEAVAGDPFALDTGTLPFPLPRRNTTLNQLAAQAGIGAAGPNKITW